MTCLHHDSVRADRAEFEHAAHLYVDEASLHAALLKYVHAALERGDAAVAIAVPANLNALLSGLAREGHDTERIQAQGQLICIDAESCLAKIMQGSSVDHQAFHSIVGTLIESMRQRFVGLSAYGELVNLLWHQGNIAAAQQVERWWNALIDRLGFTLLCGYRMNVFDDRAQSALEMVCGVHSHVAPVDDDERLERSLIAALEEVLPNGDVNAMRDELAIRSRHHAKAPRAQAVMLALNELLPSLAHEVRVRAQNHYRR